MDPHSLDPLENPVFWIGTAVEGVATYQENGGDIRNAAFWGYSTGLVAWWRGMALAACFLGWLALVLDVIGCTVWNDNEATFFPGLWYILIPLAVAHLAEYGVRRLQRKVWRARCASVEATRLARQGYSPNVVINTTCTDSDLPEWAQGPAWKFMRGELPR